MTRRCAACGNPAEGNHSIHRDGMDLGPEVDLCDACGSKERPTCAELWERIAKLEQLKLQCKTLEKWKQSITAKPRKPKRRVK